jgi:hypothetical protein
MILFPDAVQDEVLYRIVATYPPDDPTSVRARMELRARIAVALRRRQIHGI